MTEIKRLAPQTLFYAGDAVAAHLEKMAARGWLLSDVGNYIWTYRRTEETHIRYAVTYFSDASEFDPGPTLGQRTFQDYCAYAGWTFAGQWGKMLIFRTADPAAPAIETDEAVKLKTIHASQMRSFVPNALLFTLLAVMQIWMQLADVGRDMSFFADSAKLLLVLVWAVLLCYYGGSLVGYASWYLRSRRAVAQGGRCASVSRVWRRVGAVLMAVSASLVLVWLALLVWQGIGAMVLMAVAGMLVVVAAGQLVKRRLRRKGASRSENRTATLIVIAMLCVVTTIALPLILLDGGLGQPNSPARALPLKIEDLTGAPLSDETEYRLQKRVSPLMRYSSVWGCTPDDSLEYEIAKPLLPGLYDLCKAQALGLERYEEKENSGYGRRAVPAALWGADEAYERTLDGTGLNEFVLCYPDRVVKVRFSVMDLTAEQMALAAEKLREA